MESVETVMVIGGGGREQALAQKLAAENLEVVVSPGNPGNEDFAHSTGIAAADVVGQLEAAKHYGADLAIVGSEDTLDRGISKTWQVAQVLGDLKCAIFAPGPRQSWVESDRAFAKKFALVRDVPIGGYEEFTDKDKALEEAKLATDWPLFVKDNGLAQGKGTIPCKTVEEVEMAVAQLNHFVIETNVPGPELSHHAFCDGKTHLSIPFVVRDHKQLGENDSGPMTGGMGVIGPLPTYSPSEVAQLGETFVAPVVEGLGFKGMLFSGLKGRKGQERNLEWNTRFGDPETQVFMRLMKSDLLPVLMACVEGNLDTIQEPEWFLGQYAVSLVLAAPGYPTEPQQELLIEGLEVAAETDGLQVLQAGTKRKKGKLYTNGGRVINLVTVASSMNTAIEQAYKASEAITFDGQPPLIRPDIGRKTTTGY